MSIAIDKNVPIPPNGRVRPTSYPLPEMEIGDSFSVNLTGPVEKQRLYRAVSYHGSMYGKRFIVRKQPEGFRVWRVA